MRWKLAITLFGWMLREEWRMHVKLFGGLRFALFPLFILVAGAGTIWTLDYAGVETVTMVAGIHVLVFLFGLHTGSIGFIGREAVRNLLGDMTLIVFSARTLPVSKQRLLGIFVVKDAVYYSLLFLLPVTFSFAPLVASGRVEPVEMASLWVSVTGVFLLGATITLALIGLSTRGIGGRAVGLAGAVAAGALWFIGVDVTAATPYAFYLDPSATTFLTGFAAIPVIGVVGVALYDFSTPSAERTAEESFTALVNRVPGGDPLVAKSLIDLSRSSGGATKVLFSGGVIFLVSVGLIRLVEEFLPGEPSVALSMAAMLSLIAFTTYNWLTQFDDLEDYLLFPVDERDVYRAKFVSFLLASIPAGLAYYLLAVAFGGGGIGEVAVGVLVVCGLQIYLFGLTVRLAGLSPDEFMFDTVKYALFSVGVATVLVPLLIVGLVVELTAVLLIAATTWSAVAAIVGFLLYWRK